MLAKEKRLNLKKDFKWVASGRKLESKYLKLFVRQGGQANIAKVGIAISSQSFKKATQRNKARRVVSSAFEGLYQRLPKDTNIVALPKNGIIDIKSAAVFLDLEKALISEKIID